MMKALIYNDFFVKNLLSETLMGEGNASSHFSNKAR